VTLWISSWLRIGSYGGFYCSTTMNPWDLYSAKSFNYLSDYQFSMWCISRCCLHLSLYRVDRRKIGECGIGKDFERRSYVPRYYHDFLSKGTEEVHENLNKASRYAGQISKQVPSKYNRKALPPRPLIRYKTLYRIILRGSIRRCSMVLPCIAWNFLAESQYSAIWIIPPLVQKWENE